MNRVAANTRDKMYKQVQLKLEVWDLLVQIYAGDISATISHEKREIVLELAWILTEILLKALEEIDLEVSIPKCHNFLVDFIADVLGIKKARKTGKNRSIEYEAERESKKRRMRHAIDKLLAHTNEEANNSERPFPLKFSFRLLGIIVDCQWAFREHLQNVRSKAIRRYNIIKRVANTSWGLEGRILAITTHSLMESVINYGLAIMGSHASLRECQ